MEKIIINTLPYAEQYAQVKFRVNDVDILDLDPNINYDGAILNSVKKSFKIIKINDNDIEFVIHKSLAYIIEENADTEIVFYYKETGEGYLLVKSIKIR